MKQIIDDTLLFAVVILLVLCLSDPVFSGIIRTKIVCRHTVDRTGKVGIEVEVKNAGDATAYNVVVSIFLADWAQVYDNLGDNKPGGQIRVRSRFYNPDLNPGRYTLAIRVSFEEQSGRAHRAYHFSRISYRLDRKGAYKPALSFRLEPPVFNTKAFFGHKGKLKLFLENSHARRISPSIFLCLPDGFRAYEPNRYYQLGPGEERTDMIPITMDRSVRKGGVYHAVLWYEVNGLHYSELIKGRIGVEERPVYFTWYLVLSTVCLVLLSVVVYYLNRREKRISPQAQRGDRDV